MDIDSLTDAALERRLIVSQYLIAENVGKGIAVELEAERQKLLHLRLARDAERFLRSCEPARAAEIRPYLMQGVDADRSAVYGVPRNDALSYVDNGYRCSVISKTTHLRCLRGASINGVCTKHAELLGILKRTLRNF
jgi:hypothetical protein